MSTLIEANNDVPAPIAHDDMRHALMSLPVEQQQVAVKEYAARRKQFRDWIKSQMIEGTHYGFPPGCEPKTQVNQKTGEIEYGVWSKGGCKFYPASQWTPKPPLYAAGADFLVDLLMVRAEFDADMDAHKQLGSKPDLFIVRCRLYSRANGELIGEGRGARKIGQKNGDENNTVKMAEKSAKCDAILNCYGLRDLFTQDAPVQPPHDNPSHDENAPAATPRENRGEVSKEEISYILAEWAAKHQLDPHDKEQKKAFVKWAPVAAQRDFLAGKIEQWTKADVAACCSALNIPTLAELESMT